MSGPQQNPARLFTLPELAGMSGIDYRTLHNWQKRGMIRPSHQQASGSGTTSVFDEADALQVLILAELRLAGVEVKVLEQIAPSVRERAASMTDEELLLIADNGVYVGDANQLPKTLSRKRPNVVLSLATARARVGEAKAA